MQWTMDLVKEMFRIGFSCSFFPSLLVSLSFRPWIWGKKETHLLVMSIPPFQNLSSSFFGSFAIGSFSMLLSLLFISALSFHVHTYVVKFIVLFAMFCVFSSTVFIEIMWENKKIRENARGTSSEMKKAIIVLHTVSFILSSAFVYAYPLRTFNDAQLFPSM